MIKKQTKGRKPFYATKEAFIQDITEVSNNICKGMAPTVAEVAKKVKASPALIHNYMKKFDLDGMFSNVRVGRQSIYNNVAEFKKAVKKVAKKVGKNHPSVSDMARYANISETTARKYAEMFNGENLLTVTKRAAKKAEAVFESGRKASLRPGNRINGMTKETFVQFIGMVTSDLGRKPTMAEATAYLNEALAANGCTVKKNPGAVAFYANKFGVNDMFQRCQRGRKPSSKENMYSLIGNMLK